MRTIERRLFQERELACPVICTSEIVSVAQLSLI